MILDTALILFAKKPVEGMVKTRLCPPLSMSDAEEVAMLLIQQSLENAAQYWPGTIELSLSPDTDDEKIYALAKYYNFTLSRQSQGDLGDKMYSALAKKIDKGQKTMIMGCDIPHCPPEIFQTAFGCLQQNKNFIGPTIDGGYYCIGLNQHHPSIFKNTNWGTDQAYRQTISRCSSIGIQFDEKLPILQDLDTYGDLVALSSYFPPLTKYLV